MVNGFAEQRFDYLVVDNENPCKGHDADQWEGLVEIVVDREAQEYVQQNSENADRACLDQLSIPLHNVTESHLQVKNFYFLLQLFKDST